MREKIYKIIFEHDTPAGRAFDVALIVLVLGSVLAVMLETVKSFYSEYREVFFYLEWFFTVLFTIELILRLYSTDKKLKYMMSFYGIIDTLSVLPTYLAILIPGAQAFLIVRIFRLLRIFRILKLSNYITAGANLSAAMKSSRPKIIVFILFVISLVTIVGATIYFIEGGKNGFTSIPKSIYWAIVTMTTVGYGDIAPVTTLGQVLSAVLMILGYGVIAVPTGIISTEMAKLDKKDRPCPECESALESGHNFCPNCGRSLN